MPARQVHCLWSVAGSAALCVTLTLIFGGCLCLRKVEIVMIATSTTTTIFAICSTVIGVGVVIFFYLYFTEKQVRYEDHQVSLRQLNDGSHAHEMKPACLRPFNPHDNLHIKVRPISVSPANAVDDGLFMTGQSDGSGIDLAKDGSKLNKDKNRPEKDMLHDYNQKPIKFEEDSVVPKFHDYEDLYTMVCGTLLGLGSIIYFSVLFYGQLYDDDCTEKASIAGPIFSVLFVMVQIFFYLDPFKRRDRIWHNLQHRADWSVVAMRYTLMAMLGGDICMWAYSIVAETYEDFCEVEYEYYRNHTYPELCHNSAHHCYTKAVYSVGEYLIPLVAEFGLFMVQEMMEWFRDTMNYIPCTCEPNPEDMSILRQGKWGIIAGIGLIILQICSFTVYQATGHDEHAEAIDAFILFVACAVSTAILWKMWRLNLKTRKDSIHFEERIHLVILILTYISTIFYFVISLYVYACSFHDSAHLRHTLATIKNAVAPIDATLQFMVIWVVSYKEARYIKMDNTLISLMIFLFAENLAIWFSASYRYVHESHHLGDMIDYINGRLWVMSTHFALPMVIYFRFHLAETFNHFYT